MTRPDVLSFYAEAHWGSRWGVTDSYHPTPHKGLDLGLFHGIVQVPALHAGRVVAVGPSSSVGHYVTVQRSDGLYDTYCHIVPSVSVGQSVSQGTALGRQAVTQKEGGTAWAGQHTHLCLSRTQGGWGTWPTLDPTPGVIAVLTGTASSGSTPIENDEDDMAGAGLYGLFSRTDAGVVTLAVGSLTPGYETHDNYWAEAPEAKRADWEAMFGPARDLRTDVWNVRSNDPRRISDLSKFPFLGGSSAPANVDEAALAADLAKLLPGVDEADLAAAVNQIIAAIPTTFSATK